MFDSLEPGDAEAAAALSAGFGWPHLVTDWALFLELGQGVACREDGALRGTAMWFPLDDRHASIGLVQVAPGMQGRGIGRRLMEAVMAAAGGRSLVLHATEAGAALYRSLGFVDGAVVEQWQGVCRVAPTAAGVRRALPADLAALPALDAAATGLARGAMLRRWIEGAAASVVGPEGAPSGFAARRMFGRGTLIGPIVAADAAGALELVWSLAEPGFLRVDLLDPCPAMQAGLGALGLSSVDTVRRMWKGDAARGTHSAVGLMTQALG